MAFEMRQGTVYLEKASASGPGRQTLPLIWRRLK